MSVNVVCSRLEKAKLRSICCRQLDHRGWSKDVEEKKATGGRCWVLGRESTQQLRKSPIGWCLPRGNVLIHVTSSDERSGSALRGGSQECNCNNNRFGECEQWWCCLMSMMIMMKKELWVES